MVDFRTPRQLAAVRQAGQISAAPEQILAEFSNSLGKAADSYTAYYEEQAGINRERILFQIQEETQRAMNERLQDKDTIGDGFAEGFMGELDGRIEKYMVSAPERGRDHLDLALHKYRSQIETQALNAEAAARARRAAKARAAANKAKREAMQLRGNAVLSDPSLLADMVEQDPKNEDYYTKLALSARVEVDPGAVQEEVQAGNWDKNLSPSEKLTFMKQSASGVARLQREMDAELAIQQKAFEASLNEEIAFAEANGAPPPNSMYSDEILMDLYDDEADRAEIKRQYESGIAVAEMVHGVSTASVDELAAQMEGLVAAVRKPGHTTEDVGNLNNFMTALDLRNKAMLEDPAGYVAKGSEVVQDTYSLYANAEPENRDVAAETYVSAIGARYDAMGVPDDRRLLLPKDVAAQFATQFNEMAPDVATASFQEFMGQWGDAAPQIMAEISDGDNGLAAEYAVALRHWDDPGLAAEIVGLRGQSESDLREGLPEIPVRDMSRELDASLVEYRAAFEAGDVTGAATEIFNRNYSVAKRLALKYMRNGMDPALAAESVADRLFPETPIVHSRAQVILPEGIDASSADRAMDTARDGLREWGPQPLDDPRLPDFADLEVMLASAEDQGVWLNNSTGDGAILHLNVGGYLLPITNAEGEYYQLMFADIVSMSYAERVREAAKNLPRGGFGLD